jgi:hypothetical protein
MTGAGSSPVMNFRIATQLGQPIYSGYNLRCSPSISKESTRYTWNDSKYCNAETAPWQYPQLTRKKPLTLVFCHEFHVPSICPEPPSGIDRKRKTGYGNAPRPGSRRWKGLGMPTRTRRTCTAPEGASDSQLWLLRCVQTARVNTPLIFHGELDT